MEFHQETERFRFLILAMQRQGNKIYKDLLSKIGVTPSQAEVIQILIRWEPISLKELGELLICESGSPSRLIDRMVKDGFVKRIKSTKDSRFVKLQLTSLGIEKSCLIEKSEKEMYEFIERIYSVDDLKKVSEELSRFFLDSPLSVSLIKRGYLQNSEGICKNAD